MSNIPEGSSPQQRGLERLARSNGLATRWQTRQGPKRELVELIIQGKGEHPTKWVLSCYEDNGRKIHQGWITLIPGGRQFRTSQKDIRIGVTQ